MKKVVLVGANSYTAKGKIYKASVPVEVPSDLAKELLSLRGYRDKIMFNHVLPKTTIVVTPDAPVSGAPVDGDDKDAVLPPTTVVVDTTPINPPEPTLSIPELSTDITAAKAIIILEDFDNVDELDAFAKDDPRATVHAAYAKKREVLALAEAAQEADGAGVQIN